MLGLGPPSDSLTICIISERWLNIYQYEFIHTDSRNQFFELDTLFDSEILKINCTFLNPVQASYKRSCKVSLGTSQGNRCVNLSHSVFLSYEVNNTNELRLSVHLPVFLMKPVNDVTCFVVLASDGWYTAATETTLTVNPGAVKFSYCMYVIWVTLAMLEYLMILLEYTLPRLSYWY